MLLLDLIYNLAVLVAISVLSGFIDQRFNRKLFAGQILQGLLFGTTAIIGILNPFVLTEGIIFDGRSIIISLSALFFGPVSGIISALMAGLFRVYIGGGGTLTGVLVVFASLLIGLAFFYYRKHRNLEKIKIITLLMMGVFVHIVMMVLMFTLPSSFRSEAMHLIGFTVLGVYPVVTVIIGKILLDQELNQRLFAQLSESEKLFRTTLYSIGDGVITTDINGVIMQVNPAAEVITGFKEEDITGKPIGSVLTLLDEFTDTLVENPVELVIKRKKNVSLEPFLLVNAQGDKIPVADSAAPIFNSKNEMTGVVMVFRDRSNELEQHIQALNSAKSYRSLFNSIKGAAYVQDREGRFLDVNEEALKLYGYPKERFIGSTPEFLSAPGMNNLDELKENIDAAFNGLARQFEFWGQKRNGEIFPKEVSLFNTTYFNQEAIIAIAHDISERKKVEKTLRISEERYRILFNASPVGVILEDLDGKILEINKTFCDEYGYQAEELIGKNIEIIVPEKFRPNVKRNIQSIIQNKVLHSRVESLSKNNEIRVAELIETLVTLPDGERGVLSISKNITEQVFAEQTLKKSESRNKAIISAIPDLFFRFDKEMRFIDYFAEKSTLLYVQPEAFIGKSIFDVLPPNLAILTKEKVMLSLETGEIIQYEYDLKINGVQHWFDARMVKSGDEEVLVIVRNITDRKVSELEIHQQTEFIETLLESIPSPLFYMNRKGVFLGTNKAFRDFYDYEKQDIHGKTLADIEAPEIAQRNMESDQQIFDGLQEIQSLERTITLPSGEKKNVILTKSPFPDASGNIGGLIGIIVDITARKRMEEELKNAKEKAEESDRLKTSFLNNLNHEIRTPLNAIVGFSDLLFDDYPEEQKRVFVDTINNNSDQLLRIIDDVLAVSRLDSEKIPLEPEFFDLDELLNDLHITFLLVCQKKSLDFKMDAATSISDHKLYADKGKIRQIIAGFINNAIKYTKTGGINIGYTKTHEKVRFYVKDTGIGILLEEQPRIFERFFRGDEPQIEAIRGNGLGLSIALGLAELMNGKIFLESEKNIGSTFYLDIPTSSHVFIEHKDITTHKNLNKALPELSVLIVEDEKDNFEYLLALLKGHVGEITHARTGFEAIQKVKKNAFDLVLMDIKMPGMDGYDAMKQIVTLFPDMPIIAQTAYSQPDEIKQALAAGAKYCLIKPIEKESLLSMIHQLYGS
ncbi:MAG: hypothetical protein CVT92_13765 [Bacteroidetes bacterium HGW-Bacteroidetes-1]|jgi:PAS domain S-box-containing protein|nr:MAG: hypothetical protein CVT92_13765 [Bacteroidetes bacterium HGW-Bacteroidetes-1]